MRQNEQRRSGGSPYAAGFGDERPRRQGRRQGGQQHGDGEGGGRIEPPRVRRSGSGVEDLRLAAAGRPKRVRGSRRRGRLGTGRTAARASCDTIVATAIDGRCERAARQQQRRQQRRRDHAQPSQAPIHAYECTPTRSSAQKRRLSPSPRLATPHGRKRARAVDDVEHGDLAPGNGIADPERGDDDLALRPVA